MIMTLIVYQISILINFNVSTNFGMFSMIFGLTFELSVLELL